MSAEKNGIVRWVHLIPVLITCVGISVGATWELLDAHDAKPHTDAATVREYEALRSDLRDIKAEIMLIRDRTHTHAEDPFGY